MEEQGRQTESEFEKRVLARLLSAGYRVRPQWPVGAYRIDLVVDGDERRLAVECDGERWHTSEQLQSDLERQAVLQLYRHGFLGQPGECIHAAVVSANARRTTAGARKPSRSINHCWL